MLVSLAAGQTITLADGAFRVTGWRADSSHKDWTAVFPVYAGSADEPMLGAYSVESGVLRFRPRFPLTSGVRYRAVFHAPDGRTVEASFDGPKKAADASTRIEHVYPSADVLPSNVLKLYIVFSAPMSRGEAWKRIRLLDENGRVMKNAFLEIDQELLDPEMRRLTVLFDPGRVKRDLAPNLQIGAPVVEGRRYMVVVDKDFLDARGVPLMEGVRKSFRGGPADRTPPDPSQWRIAAPQAGSRGALVVLFPKPLDEALLRRALAVEGMRGSIDVGKNETEWTFTPSEGWKKGWYRLAIDNTLEDICGNRIGRAFDREEGARERAPSGKVYLRFEIR